jgi:hypothetical protein
MKGITKEAILSGGTSKNSRLYKDQPLKTFNRLFKKFPMTFDLTYGNKASFKRNKDFSYVSNKEFLRTVKF